MRGYGLPERRKTDSSTVSLVGSARTGGVALVLGLGLLGCDSSTSEVPASPSSVASVAGAPARADVPPSGTPRAELVRRSDELAAAAAHVAPDLALPRLEEAAALRVLAYESEGRKTDLLEAIELLTDAVSQEPEERCSAELRLLELRAHMTGDLKRAYLDARALRKSKKSSECHERAEAWVAALAAHAPSARELAEADRARPARDPSPVVLPTLLDELKAPTRISRIEPYVAEHTARIVLSLDHPTKFQVGVLEATESQGPRLFVDIERASYAGPPTFEHKGLVERVRVGKNKTGMRVVLDLARVAHHRVFYLPEPFRLIVDLSEESRDAKALSRELRRIVLDPGHGGTDPGAIGPSGLREKDVTLDIAHRAAPLLAREAMVSTLLTRDVDTYVSLDERAARANAFHADLFISIHMNSSENGSGRGVMTFVLDTSRDTTAAQVAARENASTAAAAAELANSLSRVESLERRQASNHFAELLQRAAGASLRQRWTEIEDHGVRKAGFYVLAGAAMPAVLFEGSFISHPIEERRLNSDAYRQALADAIVNAVRAYREGL